MVLKLPPKMENLNLKVKKVKTARRKKEKKRTKVNEKLFKNQTSLQLMILPKTIVNFPS